MSAGTTAQSAGSPGRITRRPQARHGLDAEGRRLFIDTMSVDLKTVAKFKAHGLSEKDLSTSFATIAIFSAVTAVMVFGVADLGWRAKYLAEGALFGAIGLCAVAELFSARRQTLYTFELDLDDGQHVTFVTANREEAERLNISLQTHGAALG